MLDKMESALDLYDREMLDKPNVPSPCCAVCMRPYDNGHHVIFKGHGGVPRSLEKRIPVINLCGNGNASGCHGEAHHRRLFFRWRNGWEYLRVNRAMKVDEAMAMPDERWRILPGWELIREGVVE